jgi:hypothetical protein
MMTLKKPNTEIPTVRLIARDDATGQSKSLTVYETTPEELLCNIQRLLEAEEKSTPSTPTE